MSGKGRILLVDDEPSVVKMVSKRLEVEGFEVLAALDGHEGLQKAKTEGPDLVLLDLMLPKLNGYEVCAILKRDPLYQKIPIIILSARAQEKDEKEALHCGADAFLCKPFQSQELMGQIQTLLRLPSAGSS